MSRTEMTLLVSRDLYLTRRKEKHQNGLFGTLFEPKIPPRSLCGQWVTCFSDFSSRPWRNLPPTWAIHMATRRPGHNTPIHMDFLSLCGSACCGLVCGSPCGSIVCALSQERRHINFFSGGPKRVVCGAKKVHVIAIAACVLSVSLTNTPTLISGSREQQRAYV